MSSFPPVPRCPGRPPAALRPAGRPARTGGPVHRLDGTRDPRLAPRLEQRLEFGAWSLVNDPAVTEEVYARLDGGSCERCGCDACVNYACARHLIYPTDLIDLFEWLGIDPQMESEVLYERCLGPDRHAYSGWFHLVGSIEAGPRANLGLGGSVASRFLAPAGCGVSIAFSEDRRLAPEAFEGLPVVELELAVEAPWVCGIPEPR